MVQNHTAQANWQKTRSVDDDCQIIQQAVKTNGGEISEDDLYQWLIDHGYFMSDPEFEERLEYMNRDDVRLALLTTAGKEGKQEDRRGVLPSIVCVFRGERFGIREPSDRKTMMKIESETPPESFGWEEVKLDERELNALVDFADAGMIAEVVEIVDAAYVRLFGGDIVH